MISIEQRKKIYMLYFTNSNSISIRELSKKLNISRSTLSKIIKEFRVTLEEYNLLNEDDLSQYIDLVVVEPKRKKRNVKKYIVTPQHINLIKQLVDDNEKDRIRRGKAKTILELFYDFEKERKSLKSISRNTFYNIVREIKKETY